MNKRLFAALTLGLASVFSSLSVAGVQYVSSFEHSGAAQETAHFSDLLAKQVQPGSLPIARQPDGSYLLDNALQDVQANITSKGVVFTSTSDIEGGGSFALSLAQFGRAGDLRTAVPGSIQQRGDSVVHAHPGGIAESFSNTAEGIRQDFLIPFKPEGSGALEVRLALEGASASKTDSGLQVVIDSSQRVLTYDRLRVTDANQHDVPARMQLASSHQVNIVVDDSRAVYPLTIDPTVSDANWISMGGFAGTNDAAGEIKAVLRNGTDIYVAGNFTVFGGVQANYIARWDGSAWSPLGTGTDGVINALAMDGSGNLYAGGHFTRAGAVAAADIAKWDGTSWAAMGTGANGDVLALSMDGSGNLYAGGAFTSIDGVAANHVAHWNGSSWSQLGSGLDADVNSLAAASSGNLYVGGQFTHAGGTSASHVAVWSGSAWSALGSGTDGAVFALTLDGSGNVYAGGQFATAGGAPAAFVARWDGSVWNAMGSGTDGEVRTLMLDGSGNLYVGGLFGQAGGVIANSVAVWNGSTWQAVSGDMFDGMVESLALDGSGNFYAGGVFDTIGSTAVNGFARWNGVAWSRMNGGSPLGVGGSVFAMVLDGNGNLYAGGVFTRAGGVDVNYVAKWDGSSWSALGLGMDNAVYALALDNAGNLYAGGSFTSAGNVPANYIAKWDGTAWSGLGTGMNSVVQALAVDGNGVLYAGGQFTTADNIPAKRVARWDGSAWTAMGQGMNNTVLDLVVNKAGILFAGGRFNLADGAVVDYVAQWNSSTWVALGVGMNDAVQTLAVDDSGNLYAGGLFTTAGGTPANYIAKWNGATWSPLGAGMNDAVYSLVALDGGGVYAGGRFSTAGATSVSRLASWNGSSWNALGSGANNVVQTLLADANGTLYAGGQFTVAGGKVSTFAATWLMDTDADGVNDSSDNCRLVVNADQANTDGDTFGNACDAFPLSIGESIDTDGDGIGDNADTDDDGDGVADGSDPFPLNANESLDTDGDGIGNNEDGDDDNDGVADANDAFPLDPAQSVDTDGDGIGNGIDTDDDGDGVADVSDPFPLNSAEWLDTDHDSKGNNSDTDDDGDGFPDTVDAFPLDVTETFDTDGDGTGNNRDNCVKYANADQVDVDGDKLGDVCDAFPADDMLQLQKDGSAAKEGLGAAVALADMNADGIADLLVSAPQASVLVSGKLVKKAGLIRVISGANNTVLHTLEGTVANQRFGTAIAVVADRNNDGVSDLLVGDPYATVSTTSGTKTVKLKLAGRVSLHSGVDGHSLAVVAEGTHAGDYFGAAVATGSANGDAEPDLLVGAPRADAAAKDGGQVSVFNGLTSTLLYSRQGSQAGEQFGAALAVDGSRLFVGAPFHDTATAANAGRVSIFNIAGDGTSASLLDVDGVISSNAFGSAVAAAGGDWAVSSPLTDSVGKDAGMVQLFRGLASSPVTTLSGEAAGDGFASALSMAGDVNTDGVKDLAIGTMKHDGSTTSNNKTVLVKDSGGVEVLNWAVLMP